MLQITSALLVVSAILFVVAVAVAGRTARTFAVREILRRPVQMLLAAVGTGLGVALLLSSLILAESVERSIRSIADARLGPIDVTVRFAPGRVDEESEAVVRALPADLVRANLLVRRVTLSAAPDSVGPPAVAEPDTAVFEMNFEETERFGPESVTGVPTSGPSDGEAYVSAPLSESLGLKVGDRIRIGKGEEAAFEIKKVLEVRGIAGYGHPINQPVLSVWVPRGTLPAEGVSGELLIALRGRGQELLVADSGRNDGGELEEKSRALLDALHGTISAVPPPRPVFEPVKHSLDSSSSRIGRLMRSRMLQVSGLAGMASIALVLSIFLLATEEQGRQIGIMRSLGMRRSQLVGAGGGVGASVGAAGAAIGAGVGVSAAVIALLLAGSSTGGVFGGVQVDVSVSPGVLMVGGVVAVAVAGLASVVAANRWAAVPPAVAMKYVNVETKPVRLGLVIAGSLLMVAGATMTYVGLNEPHVAWGYIGVPVTALGAALYAFQTVFRHLVLAAAALVSVGWIYALDVFWKSPVDEEGVGGAFGAAIVTVVGGATLAAVAGPVVGNAVVRAVRASAARLPVALLVASYAPSRRAQSGFVAGTFGLVVLMLVTVVTTSGLEMKEVDRIVTDQAGEWSGIVEFREGARDRGPAEELLAGPFGPEIEKAQNLVRYPNMVVNLIGGGDARVTAYVIEPEMTARDLLPLVARAPRYESDEDAWRSLQEGPNVIVSTGSMPAGVALFQSYLRQRGVAELWNISGVTGSNLLLPGIYASRDTLDKTGLPFDTSAALVRFGRGVPPDLLAKEIQGRYFDDSARVTLARELVERQLQARTYVTRLTMTVLFVGVFVGLAGLGVMMARAVRARRRDLAILRAIGANRAVVGRLVLVEGAVLAGTGVALGIGSGVYAGTRIFSAGSRFARPGIPFLAIAGVAVLVLVIGSIGAVWPAISAARNPPVESLRRADT